jgi:hypothetical protein
MSAAALSSPIVQCLGFPRMYSLLQKFWKFVALFHIFHSPVAPPSNEATPRQG